MLADLENSFLAADLHAETAVHTGQPVNLHAAVLSSDHGGTLEPFETEPTGNTGADSRHLDRRGGTLLDTDATTRAFLIMNDIAGFGLGDGSLRTLDHTRVALITGPAVKASLGLFKDRLLGGQQVYFFETVRLRSSMGESGFFHPRLGFHLIDIDGDQFRGGPFGLPVCPHVLSAEVPMDRKGRFSPCCQTFDEILGPVTASPPAKSPSTGVAKSGGRREWCSRLSGERSCQRQKGPERRWVR